MGLHRVENTSYSEPACSLHLYCPPFNQCSVFNQQTGQRNISNVTFWSKYGKKPEGVSVLPELKNNTCTMLKYLIKFIYYIILIFSEKTGQQATRRQLIPKTIPNDNCI